MGDSYHFKELVYIMNSYFNFDKKQNYNVTLKLVHPDLKKSSDRKRWILKTIPALVKSGYTCDTVQKKKQCSKLTSIGQQFSQENLVGHATPAVVKICKMLSELGIPFERERPVLIKDSLNFTGPKLFLLDFYLPPPFNIVIEADGFQHFQNRDYDQKRDRSVLGLGLGRTYRLQNQDVLRPEFDLLKAIPILSKK